MIRSDVSASRTPYPRDRKSLSITFLKQFLIVFAEIFAISQGQMTSFGTLKNMFDDLPGNLESGFKRSPTTKSNMPSIFKTKRVSQSHFNFDLF